MKKLTITLTLFGCLTFSTLVSANSGYLVISERKISTKDLISSLNEKPILSAENLGAIAPAAGADTKALPEKDFKVIHIQ